jgi:hypothetical protein
VYQKNQARINQKLQGTGNYRIKKDLSAGNLLIFAPETDPMLGVLIAQ